MVRDTELWERGLTVWILFCVITSLLPVLLLGRPGRRRNISILYFWSQTADTQDCLCVDKVRTYINTLEHQLHVGLIGQLTVNSILLSDTIKWWDLTSRGLIHNYKENNLLGTLSNTQTKMRSRPYYFIIWKLSPLRGSIIWSDHQFPHYSPLLFSILKCLKVCSVLWTCCCCYWLLARRLL